MSAASGSDAWVVGSVARRWDGRAWRNVPLPRVSNADLWSVATVAPDDAWAAGWHSRGAGPNHALIEHWNGTRWSIAQLPRLGSSILYGVSAAGLRSAWAFGTIYRRRPGKRYPVAGTLVLHWDGSAWRRQPLPWASGGLTLDKVVATGPSSVWLVGSDGRKSRIEHWNGTRWRLVYAPFGSNDPLTGFSATAGNNAWAVGSYGLGHSRVAKYSHALAAHWNGHRWQITPVPNPPGRNNSFALIDVSAARTNDAWALGEAQSFQLDGNDGLSDGTGPVAYFLHWNGQNWQPTSSAMPSVYDGSTAISATPDGSAWAIGNCFGDDFSLRWAGDTWVTAPHPPDAHWRTNGPASLPAASRRGQPPTCLTSTTAG